jgi:hypothetical protein
VLFNDRDIDNWFTNNGNQTNSNRLHSFSDAVLIVGLRPANSAIASFDMNRILLKKGNAVVGVGMNNELVKIANELFTLKQLLTNLVNAVKGLSIDVAGVGPAQGTVDPTSIAALNTVVSQIGQVLE